MKFRRGEVELDYYNFEALIFRQAILQSTQMRSTSF